MPRRSTRLLDGRNPRSGVSSTSAYLVTAAGGGRGRGGLVMSEDTVVGGHGSMAVAGPVRTCRSIDAWMTVRVGHICASRAVRARLGVLVLSGALRRDRRVYGNITVRLDMLGILLGIWMGNAILKIQ